MSTLAAKQSHLLLAFAKLRENGMRRPIGGLIQFIIGKFGLSALDGQTMRMLADLVFETSSDRLLNLFPAEFEEWLGRVVASGAERLLLRWETHDITEPGVQYTP